MFNRIIIPLLLLALPACSPVTMNGTMTDGKEVIPVTMTATSQVSGNMFSLESELPEGSIYRGDVDVKADSAVLFSPEGRSMKCYFTFKDHNKYFNSNGKAVCKTSDGQTLNFKF